MNVKPTSRPAHRPPVLGVPRECVLRFRCTPEERERIEALASAAGLSLSDHLRERALAPVDPRRR